MARSLKKGPYIDFRLEKKVEALESAGKKIGGKDLVAPLDDFA